MRDKHQRLVCGAFAPQAASKAAPQAAPQAASKAAPQTAPQEASAVV
jgi:hypothetical protein